MKLNQAQQSANLAFRRVIDDSPDSSHNPLQERPAPAAGASGLRKEKAWQPNSLHCPHTSSEPGWRQPERTTARAGPPLTPRKKDMRWRRTERRIMRVFGDQLDQRPLNKISVTQLASEAEINKATFYLHYADVYELAIAYARASADEVVDGIEHPEAFFSDPELFALEFVAALGGEERFKKGRAFVDNGLSSVFADRLAARIYEVLGGQESPESPEQSQMFLVLLVHGLMGLLPQYLEEGPDRVAQMAALVIEAMRGR